MRKMLGTGCVILGLVCLLSSLGLVFYNRRESRTAEESAESILRQAQRQILQREETLPADEDTVSEETALNLQVDGFECIGLLSVPVLELELPVLGDWTYEKLKKAPCQYFGSWEDKDFVIAAHNYPAHFGRLSELRPEDLILFTDPTGKVHCYEVVLLETLPASATEEMITSGFDLSLYTCTPGGTNRVTVRCRKMTLKK